MTKEEEARARRSNVGGHDYRNARVGIMRREYVEVLLNEGRIDTAFKPEGEGLQELVWRVHERDQEEMLQAEQRVEGLAGVRELNGFLHLEGTIDGLGASAEVRDLLHYLSCAILHFASAFKRTARGKLVHPCLTWPDRWHASWQTGWLREAEYTWDAMD